MSEETDRKTPTDDEIVEKVLEKLKNNNLAWSWANKYDVQNKADFKIAIRLAIAESRQATASVIFKAIEDKIDALLDANDNFNKSIDEDTDKFGLAASALDANEVRLEVLFDLKNDLKKKWLIKTEMKRR